MLADILFFGVAGAIVVGFVYLVWCKITGKSTKSTSVDK
jgi:hypothetical protein